MPLTLEDFDYSLPADLIAQFPAPERAGSRLLRLAGARLSDHGFADLPRFLRPGDVLVFNDTRVIKARLYGVKASGGKIEALVERVTGAHEALVQMRASHPPRPGARLCFDAAIEAEVLERRGELYLLRLGGNTSVHELLERHGHLPLPPYITHAGGAQDQARYQTVYAQHPGAVAAPTAGLHFDEAMLAHCAARASKSPGSRCTWARARSSRCARAIWPNTTCTASATTFRRPRSRPSFGARAAGAP